MLKAVITPKQAGGEQNPHFMGVLWWSLQGTQDGTNISLGNPLSSNHRNSPHILLKGLRIRPHRMQVFQTYP